MQITKDNLTIIIVTIKSEKIIDNCLSSIDSDVKKIVIENSNNEEFINNLKKKYENIECYITGKNLGMGAGNNFGIKKTKSRYVMILNPDTVLKKNTLEEIYKVSNNLDFAVLSPLSDNEDYPNYKIKKKILKNEKNIFEVDTVDGYAMVLDKTKYNEIFFDEKIFMYLENDDLCFRMKKKGEKIFICSSSRINHLGAKAVNKKFSYELELSRNWHWSWSQFYFKKKHYGLIKAFLFSIPQLIKASCKCAYYFIIANKLKFKIYSRRTSGLFNSLLNKSSWYRPRFD